MRNIDFTQISVNDSPEKTERHLKSYYFIWIIYCLIIFVCLQTLGKVYDNDAWWLIATGREIVNHGFPRFNPWAVHEGMKIVIQQWIPSVILYNLYSLGGFPAIEILIGIQAILLIAILWLTCRQYSGNKDICCLLLILISVFSLSMYFSSRPHLYTMILYSLIVYILEKYRVSGNIRYLFVLPLLTLIHVNVQSSMAIFDVFVISVYCIPDFFAVINKKFNKGFLFEFKDSDYKRIPIVISMFVCCISMLINPYGIDGALYLINSYGAANYRNFIQELAPTVMFTPYGIADLILIICGAIVIGINGKKVDFPLLVIFLVTTFLSIQHLRNTWLVALFSLPFISRGIRDLNFPCFILPKLHKKIYYLVFGIVLADIMLIYAYSTIWPTLVNNILIYKTDTFDLPLQACDWIDENMVNNNLENKKIKVFNTFNNGSVLEFRGYQVLMDPRPELWEPGITGLSEHYYEEYVDFQIGKVTIESLLERDSYDFYLIRDNSPSEEFFLNHKDLYQIEVECNGYKLWGNKNT